ncbi:MAG: hypothetical protein ACOZCL_09745 [Bacillota bacterium]
MGFDLEENFIFILLFAIAFLTLIDNKEFSKMFQKQSANEEVCNKEITYIYRNPRRDIPRRRLVY